MFVTSALWLLLAGWVAAADINDDAGRIDFDDDIMYHDDSKEVNPLSVKDWMIQPVGTEEKNDHGNDLLYRLNLRPVKKNWITWPFSRLFSDDNNIDLETAAKKRTKAKAMAVKGIKIRPKFRQPRWKIKRPPGLCLLKVCSPFRYVYE